MNRKDPRSEYAANVTLANRELRTMTFHPNFLKPAPVRVPQKRGIISTFAKLLGR
jgi:hypothetical protein